MGRLRTIAGVLAGALLCVSGAAAQDVAGEPLNGHEEFPLPSDLGAGKSVRPSLGTDFQDWGAMAVSATDGFPVRLGERSIRFETREGFCGVDPGEWSDCDNGRSRHELSTAGDFDPWNRDSWYVLSLYIPDGFDAPENVKTSIFQFWSGGYNGWQFKFETGRGFFVQRKFDNTDTVVVEEEEAVDHWVDYLLRVRHSAGGDGTLTLWANGERVYDYAGVTGGENAALRPYFKFGIYNTAMGPDGAPIDGGGYGDGKGLPNLHLFFDEVRFGATCADLDLSDLGYDCANFTDEGADRTLVAELQTALNALGCNVGAADGVIGPRTRESALTCRHFEPGTLPDALTIATLPVFVALYTAEGTADLPTEAPSGDVEIVDVSLEIVGNGDVAINVEARAAGLDLAFIAIGSFDDQGRTPWLDILLADDLGQPIPEAVTRCPRVRTETWGDGSTHAVLQFDAAGTGYRGRGGDCLVAALPEETAREAEYLLGNFASIAAAADPSRIDHAGARAFIEGVAAGSVAIGR